MKSGSEGSLALLLTHLLTDSPELSQLTSRFILGADRLVYSRDEERKVVVVVVVVMNCSVF